MTEFEAPIQGPLRNPDLPEEIDRELDKLGEVMPAAQAWSIVEQRHGISEEDLTDAARRTVEDEPALFSERTTPSKRTLTIDERAALGKLKDSKISQEGKRAANGLAKPDDSHLPEATPASDKAVTFINEMLDDIGTFDLAVYLEKNPHKRAEASELGFLKEAN